MVVHLALGIEAAGLGTRIRALLVDAGQVLGALRADHALGSALGRSSEVAHLAAARGMSLHGATDAVGSAGIWLTDAHGTHDGHPLAALEGIALEAARAAAAGQVVDHRALGICSASRCAGIAAVLLDAGQRRGALGVVYALWTTAGAVGIAKVGFDAGTAGGIVVGRADGVLCTRIGVAGTEVIAGLLHTGLGAADEGIALVALVAAAVGGVGDDRAAGVVPADIGARVLALLLDAGLVRRTLAAQRALRTAVGRAANVVGHAGANRAVLLDLANGVGSARGWHARILWHVDFASGVLHGRAGHERIALEVGLARADRVVVEHLAAGSTAANSRAGIGASLVQAGLARSTLRAHHALRLADGRSTLEVRQARAGGIALGVAKQRELGPQGDGSQGRGRTGGVTGGR